MVAGSDLPVVEGLEQGELIMGLLSVYFQSLGRSLLGPTQGLGPREQGFCLVPWRLLT